MHDIELLKTALNASHDGMFIAKKADNGFNVVHCNSVFTSITGLTSPSWLSALTTKIIDGGYQDQIKLDLEHAITNEENGTLKVSCKNAEGRVFCITLKWEFYYGTASDDSNDTYLIGSMKDITQEEYSKNVMEKVNYLFREMSRRLEYTNETDQLTKLKNRGHLCTRGEFLLGAAKREKLRIHAIVIDVDNFKTLNTVGGAGLGDECLITVADIISRYFCRATDIAIRLCDDEFVVLCIEDDDKKVLERIDSVRYDISNTKIRDTENALHDISVSVGIHSVNPEKRTTLDDMIHQAGELVFTHIPTNRNRISHISDHQKIKRIAK